MPHRPQDAQERARSEAGELRVAGVLERMALPRLHNVYLPFRSGEMETTRIDHLVFLGDRTAVIETVAWQSTAVTGNWLSDEKVFAEWSDSGDTRTMLNPVLQNHRHCLAVRAALTAFGFPRVPLLNLVDFAGSYRP